MFAVAIMQAWVLCMSARLLPQTASLALFEHPVFMLLRSPALLQHPLLGCFVIQGTIHPLVLPVNY